MNIKHWRKNHVETGFYPPATYLLIDDLYVAKMDRVRRVAGVPTKMPGQIIKPEHPREDRKSVA